MLAQERCKRKNITLVKLKSKNYSEELRRRGFSTWQAATVFRKLTKLGHQYSDETSMIPEINTIVRTLV